MVEEANAQEVGQIDPGQLGVPTEAGPVISALIQLALAAAGLIFFGMLVLGGLKYLTAGGDEKAATSARGTLTHAFIGLVIVVAAFLLAQLLFGIFGLEGIISFQ